MCNTVKTIGFETRLRLWKFQFHHSPTLEPGAGCFIVPYLMPQTENFACTREWLVGVLDKLTYVDSSKGLATGPEIYRCQFLSAEPGGF